MQISFQLRPKMTLSVLKVLSHTMFKGPTMLLHQSGHYMYLALRKTNSATAAETANCKIQVTIYHHAMMMVRVVVE